MKNAFSKLLVAAFVTAAPAISHAVESVLVGKKPAVVKDEPQEPAVNAAMIAILNQIVLAKLDFDLDVSFKITQKDGESKSAIDFKYLDISAMVKFKDQILYSFVDGKKTNAQLRKIIPEIKFTTKDMFVVSKIRSAVNGKVKISVRFCQSYSVNNDLCNTFDDKKLLDISVNSTNFGMFDMRIKDINLDFDQKIADGKFSFSGTCTAWKSGFDLETPDKNVMNPAICEFSGVYDSNAAVKFEGNFKLKSKK